MARLRIVSVVGARPNLMKIAPILKAMGEHPAVFESILVHTGQHYDDCMSSVFFAQLDIPEPVVNLNVGGAAHAIQTAAVMTAFDPILVRYRPDLVLVVGDVNSTLACALVATKRGIPVAHVEAGLRSFDRSMPEEVNRVLTDHISELLFTSESSAGENLHREGVHVSRIHFVGNVMVDTLLAHRKRARALDMPATFGLLPKHYGVLTLHRPSNVDDVTVFERLMRGVAEVGRDCPLVFPVHPRTRDAIARSGTASRLISESRLRITQPLGYLEFLGLLDQSRVVLTDSGGVQEESTVLQVPCLTLRDNTERPVTVTQGTNQVVGTDPDHLRAGWSRVMAAEMPAQVPPLWDGSAARRIVDVLRRPGGPITC